MVLLNLPDDEDEAKAEAGVDEADRDWRRDAPAFSPDRRAARQAAIGRMRGM